MMQIVADKLAALTKQQKKKNNADAFGRSAYNRYYYTAYLTTREMLYKLDPKWTRTGHKEIPNLLEKTILTKMRKTIHRQVKNGLLKHSDSAKHRDSINISISTLSDLLRTAYNIRVIADYEPETKLEFNNKSISLGNTSLDAARHWHSRVAQATKLILRTWEQLGIS